MTVAARTPSVSAVATSGQTVFTFNFRVDAAADLKVYQDDVAQAGGSYAVSLNADQTAAPGGNVTFGVGRPLGAVISVERASAQTQSVDLTTRARLPSTAFELALDKLLMFSQEIWALLSRALVVSRGTASQMASLQLPAPQLGAVIGWVDGGGGLVRLGNINGLAQGELLTDSGDHQHYTSAHVPVGTGALYLNGQRVFAPGDYTVAGNTWTFVTPNNAGAKANADYSY